MAQLRTHLDEAEFRRRVLRQRSLGYQVYGGFNAEGVLVGVMGMRPVATLARGEHLHVDDVVVDASLRSAGIGRALMTFAETWAQNLGLQSVFLDSRPEAMNFYKALGYTPHTATLVRKGLAA